MHIFWNLLIGWLVLFASVSYAGWTPPVRISDEATAYSPRIVGRDMRSHIILEASTGELYGKHPFA
jgi:hypothetical protein